MLSDSCSQQLEELTALLLQLSPTDYSSVSPIFRNSSIGQHVRHILELFDCLLTQYESGEINYDLRKRDLRLENDLAFVFEKIREIQVNINHSDKSLLLFQGKNQECQPVNTTYFRELLYNLEHCVHHQALIRLACFDLPYVFLPETFGVASSTIKHHLHVNSEK